jgi:hypothetical protein
LYRETFAILAHLPRAAAGLAARLGTTLFIDALLTWLTALAGTNHGGE